LLIYLFGLPAAGKNFVGRVLADEFGFYFHDGDLNLTDELRQAVRDQRPFTDAMRDRYYAVLIERMVELTETFEYVAVGQATFKERHRQQIAARFPGVVFILVTADEDVRMERLRQGFNPVTVEYARRIVAFFEPPQHPHFTVVNNGNRREVIEQLDAILASLASGGRVPSPVQPD
jgi:gluconate kinase